VINGTNPHVKLCDGLGTLLERILPSLKIILIHSLKLRR
jgi:hypothetical protein